MVGGKRQSEWDVASFEMRRLVEVGLTSHDPVGRPLDQLIGVDARLSPARQRVGSVDQQGVAGRLIDKCYVPSHLPCKLQGDLAHA